MTSGTIVSPNSKTIPISTSNGETKIEQNIAVGALVEVSTLNISFGGLTFAKSYGCYCPQGKTAEKGFRGAWYSGTVLEIKDSAALVEFNEILEDDGGALPPLLSVFLPFSIPLTRLSWFRYHQAEGLVSPGPSLGDQPNSQGRTA